MKKKSKAEEAKQIFRELILAAWKKKGGYHSSKKGKKGYTRKKKHKEINDG